MRDPARIPDMLARLEKLWKERPDLRLGQLILNVAHAGEDLYYLEDEALLARLEELYGNPPRT
jgi:hypothetical protein